MLSQELRPFDFSEMAGQEENIKLLQAVIRNPEKAPKCLIFAGAFGSGKTTSARILARALNHITDRSYDLLNSPFYYEYDSTVIGNVETIRQMRDQFTISYGDYYRVIVFDECHTVSTAAQNALLKVLEEAIGKVFFVLSTTEPNKLLPTIRSRSLQLEFKTVPVRDVYDNVTRVCRERNILIPDDIKALIADRSGGHMRNAHMLLDKYLLLGDEDFRDSIKSAIRVYCDFLIAVYASDKQRVLDDINTLLNLPMDDLRSDWNAMILEAMAMFVGNPPRHECVRELVNTYKGQFNSVINIYFAKWTQRMFTDMSYFQASLMNIYIVLNTALSKARKRESQPTEPAARAYVPNSMQGRRTPMTMAASEQRT